MRTRFALGLLVLLAGCSSDGSSNIPSVPVLPWGSFRHDGLNSGVGAGINRNQGEGNTTAFITAASLGGVTISTPAIDSNGNLYIGTETGVASFDPQGMLRWRATECLSLADGSQTAIGRVRSSPTVTPGNVIVFGSDGAGTAGGAVFALEQGARNSVSCMWAFRPPDAAAPFTVASSPAVQVDPLDLSLLAAISGGSHGRLQAINGDGTPRWSFPSGMASGELSSSPALTLTGITYVTTPDGLLAAIDFSGRPMWSVVIGVPADAALRPSPAAATTIYAIGAASTLYGVNPNGSLKWQYVADAPLSGSPAFLGQSIEQGTETISDTIVYIVDVTGTVTGVRDATGAVVQLQRCSLLPTQSCRMDSCPPGQGSCNGGTQRCSISNVECTTDTCLPDDGTCTAVTGMVPIAGQPVPVDNSLTVSGDAFVVVGTGDGRLCARGLDGTVPGDDEDPENAWVAADGCLTLGAGLPARSSPAIGRQGAIYVTTDEGLFVIQ